MRVLKREAEPDDLVDLGVVGGFVELGEDFPVRELAGLGYAEGFEAVEGLGVLEVGVHGSVDLGLGLPGLLGDGGLHALAGAGGAIAALFDRRRFVSHQGHQLQQLCVLLLAGEGRDLLGGGLGGLREPRTSASVSSRWLVLALHLQVRGSGRLV